jgi:hypothetical protein
MKVLLAGLIVDSFKDGLEHRKSHSTLRLSSICLMFCVAAAVTFSICVPMNLEHLNLFGSIELAAYQFTTSYTRAC